MDYYYCMSHNDSDTTDVESLTDIFTTVTGTDTNDAVITEQQKHTPSHEAVDEETREITRQASESVTDGLKDATDNDNAAESIG